MLSELHLRDVGPAPALDVEFAERLNIFTGDNGLGKTFLLDCAWWALTGSWPGPFALPKRGSTDARIGFFYPYADSNRPPGDVPYDQYDYRAQIWPRGYDNSGHPAIYARADGGVSVFDPLHKARWFSSNDSQHLPQDASLHFDAGQIWQDLKTRDGRVLCNGLIRDLVHWQFSPDRNNNDSPFATFERVLRTLTHLDEPIRFGMPAKVYVNDELQYPMIETPHETIPIHLAPSGLKRILGLAYLMVWAHTKHRTLAGLTNVQPSEHLDVLVDEIELHLHPKWQRSILPAIVEIGEALGHRSTQLLITTHSPLVLASVEPNFDVERDRLFLFDVEEGRVSLNELPWAKHGDATNWLTSPIFGLAQARSLEAETAIEAAEAFMRRDFAALPEGLKTKEQIHAELCRVVAGHDEFWPRWVVKECEVSR